MRGTAFRAPRWRIEAILAPTLALPREFLHRLVILLLRHGSPIHLFLGALVVPGQSSDAAAPHALPIAVMDIPKEIEADSLCLAARVAPQKMEGKTTPLVHREGGSAIQTFCSKSLSHVSLSV